MNSPPLILGEKTDTLGKDIRLFHDQPQLQGKTRYTIKQIVNYSKKKYGYILDAGDTSPLMGLSDRNKHHAMCAIANLAKFQNRYEAWNSNRQVPP